MSFTERAGLLPVLLLSGCASPVVVTVPPSGNVVDGYLTRSAADISAMQFRLHQSGSAAQRPTSPAAKSLKPASTPSVSVSGAGPTDGFVRQNGAAPTLREALRKIIPPGQTVVFDRAVYPDAPALWRWTGNDRWQYVVDKMLAARGLKATVNVKARSVVVGSSQHTQAAHAAASSASLRVSAGVPAKAATADPVKATPLPASGRNPFSGDKTGLPASQDKPSGLSGPAAHVPDAATTPASVVQLRHWRIETGNTVKDWLYSQASAETCHVPGIKNWTIAWLTPVNYRVDAPLNFDGSFREMLNRLFTLYGTAKVPLYAGVRAAQCIVSVDDKEVN